MERQDKVNLKLENIFFEFLGLISSLKLPRSLISHLFNIHEAILTRWGSLASKITCQEYDKPSGDCTDISLYLYFNVEQFEHIIDRI